MAKKNSSAPSQRNSTDLHESDANSKKNSSSPSRKNSNDSDESVANSRKNSSAHSRRKKIDLDDSHAASRRNVTDSIESDAASTPKSSPSPSNSDSTPPESSSQSPPPSASPPPPKTSPTPEPSPSPPPPKLSPPPPSSPRPSSNNNSSSPTGNPPSPPSPSAPSPPSPSPPPPPSPSPPPPPSSPPPPPPSPSPSPPPSPSSSAPPPPSGSESSNKSPPSPVSASPPTRQSSRSPQTWIAHPSGSGSNSQSPASSTGLSHGSPAKSSGFSDSSSRGDSENTGKFIGFALAGVFFVALVAVVIVFVLRRKRKGTEYKAPYVSPDDFPMKPDGHPYVQQHGAVNVPQEGFYGSQPPHTTLGGNFKTGATRHSVTRDVGVKVSQIVFSFENILEITNGLSRENVIGEGGFGCVYKAWLPDGRIVAVKQLKADSGQGEREFKAEVEIISRIHHRHLVSLVGYCISEQQRILVYEFVPNKTLDQHLHGSGMQVLDWAKRVKIALGAAKGLAYLHEDCNPKIIHRDIKSANILLDDSFEARVADFGLAKLNNDANTHVSTRVMGTFGYLAPEYATSGKLTDRSDVFSFGVVLLELITGRKPVDQTQPIGDESLVEWARPLLIQAVETGDCSQLIDPKLEGNFVESEMHRMVEAAAACIRHSAPKRPRMIQVVRALDSRDDLSDLSNGVKYGQSIVYDSGQYNEDIMRFRMNNSFGSSEIDMHSGECNSKEFSGLQNSWALASYSGESETRAFNKQSFRTQHFKVEQPT